MPVCRLQSAPDAATYIETHHVEECCAGAGQKQGPTCPLRPALGGNGICTMGGMSYGCMATHMGQGQPAGSSWPAWHSSAHMCV